MVNDLSEQLTTVFLALADPTRRAILERLAYGEASGTELEQLLSISENGSSIVGTYLHIVAPAQLVFTWSGAATQGRETVVTLDFLEQGSGTEVVLTHERLSTPELRALFGGGWQPLLAALAEALSSPVSPADAL